MKTEISLKDALSIIDKTDALGNAIPFDITFRSLQRNSKTGGKLYEYLQVKKLRVNKEPAETKTTYKVGADKTAYYLKAVQAPIIHPKNPNHFKNRTRNLELQNGDKKKIHIRLIISVNGYKVIY